MKKLLFLAVASAFVLSSCNNGSVESTKVETEVDSVSYALGVSISANLKQGNLEEVNAAALAKGVADFYAENENMIFTNEEANKFLQTYFQKLSERVATKTKEEGEAFLAENAKKEGVITTESGIQYEIITEGTGAQPVATDMVKVHYAGTLINGESFDSSIERGEPAQFRLDQVIKGWTEGVQLMKVGSKYKFYIPSDLAYGSNPRPGGKIKPNETLIFEVELLEIVKQDEAKN